MPGPPGGHEPAMHLFARSISRYTSLSGLRNDANMGTHRPSRRDACAERSRRTSGQSGIAMPGLVKSLPVLFETDHAKYASGMRCSRTMFPQRVVQAERGAVVHGRTLRSHAVANDLCCRSVTALPDRPVTGQHQRTPGIRNRRRYRAASGVGLVSRKTWRIPKRLVLKRPRPSFDRLLRLRRLDPARSTQTCRCPRPGWRHCRGCTSYPAPRGRSRDTVPGTRSSQQGLPLTHGRHDLPLNASSRWRR